MAQESVKRDDAKTARTAELPSIIAFGLRIVGHVASAGVVHIEGEVDGDIECAELTIGSGGRVDGDVTAATVHVFGKMSGTIRARTVHIAAGAIVAGEVIHETLTVEPGAYLDGYYRPVENVEMSAGVDVRRHIGRTAREAQLPHRPLPPRSKGRGRPATLPVPRNTAPKPLH